MLPIKSKGLLLSLGVLCFPGSAFAEPVVIFCFRSDTLPLLSQTGVPLNTALKAPPIGNGIPADYEYDLIHFTLNRKAVTISADVVRIKDPSKEVGQALPPGGSTTSRFETKGLTSAPPPKPSNLCQ